MVGLVIGQLPVVGAGDLVAFSRWARTRLSEMFPCGGVSVDGDEVGFWMAFASAPDAERWEVFVAWRQPPDEDDLEEGEPRPPDTPRALTFVTEDNDLQEVVSGVVEDPDSHEECSFPALAMAMRNLLECLQDETYQPDNELLRMLWLLAGLPAGWSDPVRFLARPKSAPEALDLDGAYADAAREAAVAHFKPEVGAFLDTLDSEAFEFILERADAHHAAWPALSTLFDGDTWKGLDDTFVDGAPLRVAVDAHPGLVDLLCHAWGKDEGLFPRSGSPDIAGVLRAVTGLAASRVSVAAAVARMEARRWELPVRSGTWAVPATGLPFRLPGRREWAWPDVASLVALAGYPDDTVPRFDAAWAAFEDVWPAVALADGTLRDGIDPAPFLGLDAAGGWEAVRSTLAETVGGGTTAYDAVAGVPDMMQAFQEQVLLPARALSGSGLARPAMDAGVARQAAETLSRRLLVTGRSLVAILAAHRAWSTVEVAFPGDHGAYESVLEAWRPILPEACRPLGMVGFAELLEGVVVEMGGVPPTVGERAKGVGAAVASLFRRK